MRKMILFVAILLIAGKTGAIAQTPLHIILEEFDIVNELQDTTYFVSKEPMDWMAAKAKCESFGGQLVTIADSIENGIARQGSEIRNCYAVWIGLTDEAVEGEWQWVDGTPLGTYQPWAVEQPDNDGDEDYGMLYGPASPYSLGAWNDLIYNDSAHEYYCVMEVLNEVIPVQGSSWGSVRTLYR